MKFGVYGRGLGTWGLGCLGQLGGAGWPLQTHLRFVCADSTISGLLSIDLGVHGGLGNMTIHVRHLTMYDSSFDERTNVSRRMIFFNARAGSIA